MVAVVVKLTTPLDCRPAQLCICRWVPGDVVLKCGWQHLVVSERPHFNTVAYCVSLLLALLQKHCELCLNGFASLSCNLSKRECVIYHCELLEASLR